MSIKKLYRNSFSTKTKTVGYGYVGRWRDGKLGWFLPSHLAGDRSTSEPPSDVAVDYVENDDRFTLCRITIEEVPGVRRIRHPDRKKT